MEVIKKLNPALKQEILIAGSVTAAALISPVVTDTFTLNTAVRLRGVATRCRLQR
jgi:hypothetical protein